MQESRLFKIMYYLLDRGRATAPKLAEEFEVSVRTIYRDVDALSQAGIPVYTETGRNGGICLMDDFVLDRAVLSEEEKREILTALQSIHAIRSSGSRTLQKLSAMFGTGGDDWLEVDFSRWGDEGNDNEKFELLKSAVIRRRRVNICYAGVCSDVSERIVEPYKLVYKARSWYLKAFCTKREDWRIFKLSRIVEFELLSESFLPRPLPEPEESSWEDYEQITLRFPGSMAYRVYDEFDQAHIHRQENGDLIVSEKMPNDAWLAGCLLSFGTDVEIVSPASLKNGLAKLARSIYEKNKP